MPHSAIINSLNQILPKQERRALGLLQVFPEDVSFDSQNPGEEIFIMVRSHIITNIGWVIRWIIGLVAPFIALFLLHLLNNALLSQQGNVIVITDIVSWEVLVTAALFYFTLLASYFIANFVDWYFDIYLVTNERLIHIDFQIFTGKFVAEAPLVNIEDISQNIIGFLPSVFHFGDILVQTAAEKSKFNLKSIPDPNWFRDVLADLALLAKRYEKQIRKSGEEGQQAARIPVQEVRYDHSHRYVDSPELISGSQPNNYHEP